MLSEALVETSGLALSRTDERVLWTHNDGDSPLFAIDRQGSIIGSRRVRPGLRDWEDIASARCAPAGTCLYFADTGDNGEVRPPGSARIVRVPEPSDPRADAPLTGEVHPIAFPDGPRDVEAIFVLPGERVYVITKGRQHPITVYRYPPPLRSEVVTLVESQRLTDSAAPLASQVTGASATLDGSVVAVRTYQSVTFYRPVGDTLRPIDDGVVNLRSLREVQGEGVALLDDGEVFLTSEGGVFGAPPGMNVLRCVL